MSITHFEAVITATGACLITVGTIAVKARKPVRRVLDFLDDFNGRPARPGREAEPGVLERLANLDDGQVHIIERLTVVEKQVNPNGGGSMHDKVNVIAQVVASPPRTKGPT